MGRRGPQSNRQVHGQIVQDAAYRNQLSNLQKQAGIPDRDEVEAMATALLARERVYGVRLSDVKDQRAGSIIGRLRMMHEARLKAGVETPDGLSGPQYEAALKYQEVAEAHARVVCAPKGMVAADLNRVGGPSVDEAARDVRDARIERAYREARDAVQHCQNHHRTGVLFAALDLLVLRDKDMPHMYGDLRVVLNALARHFELIDGRDAA